MGSGAIVKTSFCAPAFDLRALLSGWESYNCWQTGRLYPWLTIIMWKGAASFSAAPCLNPRWSRRTRSDAVNVDRHRGALAHHDSVEILLSRESASESCGKDVFVAL